MSILFDSIGDRVRVIMLEIIMVLVRVKVNLVNRELIRLFMKLMGVYIVIRVVVMVMMGMVIFWVFLIVVLKWVLFFLM